MIKKPQLLITEIRDVYYWLLCFGLSGAAEYLYFHRVLVQPDDKRATDSLWGKLASEILMQDWDTAWEDLHRLRDNIDSNIIASPLQVVACRFIRLD